MSESAAIVWDEGFLGYDLGGSHPLHPVRLALTMALANDYGLLGGPGVQVIEADEAPDDVLEWVHDAGYVAAVRAASVDPDYVGCGLGSLDNPVFATMHDSAALIAGGSVRAAQMVWSGEVQHAVNIAGGLHHAMRSRASGFCVYNDAALAIAGLLRAGASRIAYVDVDVHHGDGVQAAFYDDPRVLTISLHESPLSLFPGTGFPDETGAGAGVGCSANVALPSGTADAGWLRAFHAVVPGLLRAFRPEVLVTQCGCDTHREDPLADLALTVDAQKASYVALHALAHEVCDGRWLALGGGGYGLVRAVPRAWTHLIGELVGRPVDPGRPIPGEWVERVRELGLRAIPPDSMTDGGDAAYPDWEPGGAGPLDQAITEARQAVFPQHGLDPSDPRD